MLVRRVVLAFAGLAALGTTAWLGYSMAPGADVGLKQAVPIDVSARVERRTLATVTVLRGSAVRPDPVALAMPAPPRNRDDVASVVTWVPQPGQTVAEGDVLVEVHGRPLIFLQGVLPLTRELRLRAEGSDVEQLQEALIRLGFDPGPIDGLYGPATLAAIEDLYAAAGYEPPPPHHSESEAVDAAQRHLHERTQVSTNVAARLDTAAASAAAIAAALDDASVIALEAEAVAADAAVAAAREQLDDAVTAAATRVLLSEVVFLPQHSYVVDRVASVGYVGNESPVALVAGDVEVLASAAAPFAERTVPGTIVSMFSEEIGAEWTGTVTAVEPNAAGSDAAYTIRIRPDGDPESLLGRNVAIQLELEEPTAEGLVVPSTAVWTSPTGTHVTVLADDQTQRTVGVSVIHSIGGFSQVEPIDGSLAEGDHVLVGTRG